MLFRVHTRYTKPEMFYPLPEKANECLNLQTLFIKGYSLQSLQTHCSHCRHSLQTLRSHSYSHTPLNIQTTLTVDACILRVISTMECISCQDWKKWCCHLCLYFLWKSVSQSHLWLVWFSESDFIETSRSAVNSWQLLLPWDCHRLL